MVAGLPVQTRTDIALEMAKSRRREHRAPSESADENFQVGSALPVSLPVPRSPPAPRSLSC
eukprot:3694362-Rhodomonas_salina.1